MLRIQIDYRGENAVVEHADGPFEFGRGPQRNGIPRHIVSDSYVSANHVRLDPNGETSAIITNLSTRNNIRLSENDGIAVGASRELRYPIAFMVGETLIKVDQIGEEIEEDAGPMDSLECSKTVTGSLPSVRLLELGASPSPQKLAKWLETLLAVQKSAVGSPEFFKDTAQALVDLIGLDRGLVLMIRQGRWMVQARYPDEEIDRREFSTSVLAKMSAEHKTFYQSGSSLDSHTESIMGIQAVIASPIMDNQETIVGAVYGVRNRLTGEGNSTGGINPLEAQIVQLLASTVGVGLARQEQEAAAGKLRVQFEQFFSADLARELQRNPKLLEGHESEITVLFADIRGFSRISEYLTPTDSCHLVSDVMEELTACVRSFDGVVVDYAGDGLMAMWNAPAEQAGHAAKACRAALAMIEKMPSVQERWKDRVRGNLRVGVGINTGRALCGNTGSKIKFKYGPLGHAVNLASRIEGATKVMGVPILISGSTKKFLGEGFATRRLRKVRVVGIQEVVDLYQLHASVPTEGWNEFAQTYEKALAEYEASRFGQACSILYPLISEKNGEYDGPSLSLMAKTIEFIRKPAVEGFCGVEELESK